MEHSCTLQEGTRQHKYQHTDGEDDVDRHARMARGHEKRNIILLVFDTVARRHLHDHPLVRPEGDRERAVRAVDARLRVGDVRVLERRLVDVEHRVDVVLHVVVVAVEDVIVVPIRHHLVLGDGMRCALEIPDALARFARWETMRQQDITVIAGK